MPAIRQVPEVEVSSLQEITVLVTGYGAFLDDVIINPSWSIASSLPTSLPPTATCPYKINLQVPADALRVAYKPVMHAVPALLNPPPGSGLKKPDLILHIGLAAGRAFYTLERQSMGGSYAKYADVDGEFFNPIDRAVLFKGCPHVLKPTFDTNDVWRRWRDNVGDATADLRPSDDPGMFLCGFIYYLSMAHFYQMGREEERPVIFLHVPNLQSEEQVEQGRQVTMGLVRAMVASRMKLGKKDPLLGVEQVSELGEVNVKSMKSAGVDGVQVVLEESAGWSGVRA